MILKIYNNVEILIDDEDCERILKKLSRNSSWHLNKVNNQIVGWCDFQRGEYVITKKIQLGRVIMNCYEKHLDVDHKNHNLFDFRKSELRVCTHQENCFNTRIHSNNTSGSKGVYWKKDRKKWYSRIRTKNGRINLGGFDKKEDAEKAYNDAVVKYHGEFSTFNKPQV